MTRVLVSHECSGVVRRALRARGVDAWSCDLKPSHDDSAHHMVAPVQDAWHSKEFDDLIAFPDCTYLTASAAWAYADPDLARYPGVGYHQKVKPGTLTGQARRAARDDAIAHVRWLMTLPVKRRAIENPARGFISSAICRPSQIIQPHEFGEDASKATGLWLWWFPPLQPTQHVAPRMVGGLPRWGNQTDGGQNRLAPSETRAHDRAQTYPGVAQAMADQWYP